MNRTSVAINNITASMIQNVITLFSGIIITKIILNVYGSEINGLISSITQFIMYLTLLEAGLAGASIYALYKPLADQDTHTINGIISATKKYYLVIFRIFLFLIIVLAVIYPQFIKIESMNRLQMGFFVIILSSSGLLEFLTLAKYRAILMSDQKSYIISHATSAYTLANVLIIYILAEMNLNILIVRFIAIFAIILRVTILSTYISRKYNYLNFNEAPNKYALKNRLNVFFLQLLISVQQGSPIVIATLFTNLKIVSVFSIYNVIMSGINNLLGLITAGMTASFGNIIVKKEQKLLQKTVDEFEFIYYNVLLVLYSVTLAMFMPFVRLYTSNIIDVNYDIKYLAFLCVLNGFLYNLQTPHGLLVISAGLFKETRFQSTIQAFLLVFFGSTFAYFYGINGILIGGIISNIYRTIDLVIFINKNLTKRGLKKCFYRIGRTIALFFTIELLLSQVNFNSSNYFIWILFVILSGVISFVIIYLFSWLFEKNDLLIAHMRILNICRMLKKKM